MLLMYHMTGRLNFTTSGKKNKAAEQIKTGKLIKSSRVSPKRLARWPLNLGPALLWMPSIQECVALSPWHTLSGQSQAEPWGPGRWMPPTLKECQAKYKAYLLAKILTSKWYGWAWFKLINLFYTIIETQVNLVLAVPLHLVRHPHSCLPVATQWRSLRPASLTDPTNPDRNNFSLDYSSKVSSLQDKEG